jgi:hypothetical protein
MSYDQTRRKTYMAAVAAVAQIIDTVVDVPTHITVKFHAWADRPSLDLYFHDDVAGVEAFARQFDSYCTSEGQGSRVVTTARGEFAGFEFEAWTLVERAA